LIWCRPRPHHARHAARPDSGTDACFNIHHHARPARSVLTADETPSGADLAALPRTIRPDELRKGAAIDRPDQDKVPYHSRFLANSSFREFRLASHPDIDLEFLACSTTAYETLLRWDSHRHHGVFRRVLTSGGRQVHADASKPLCELQYCALSRLRTTRASSRSTAAWSYTNPPARVGLPERLTA